MGNNDESNQPKGSNRVSGQPVRKTAIAAASILVYLAITNTPLPEGLSLAGQKSIALMIAAILWWVFEIIPVGVSTLLFTMLLGFLDIIPTSRAMGNFFSPTLIFVISALIIGRVFIDTGLGERVSLYVSTLFGKKSRMVVLSFMLPTALVSSFLVDIPTAIIFGSMAYELLQTNNCMPGKSNFGKAMMMGIPIASALGGFGTPAGSGINVMSINLMKQVAGIELTFAQWTIIGFPMAIVLTLAAWFILIKLYPPEFEEVKGLDNVKEERKNLSPLNAKHYKFMIIFSFALICWFTGILSVPLTSIIAVSIFFLPGFNLITWKDASSSIPWHMILLIGAAQSLGLAIFETGGAEWIADSLLGSINFDNTLTLLIAITAFGIYSHLILPVAIAVLSVCIPVLAILAQIKGLPVSLVVLPIAYTASCVFLMPLDPVPLTTFEYGYWKFHEMPIPGFIISVVWIIVNVIAMLIANNIGIL